MNKSLSIVVAAGVLFLPALADARKTEAVDKNDPNRVVCRSESNTGSRLAQTKRCMTVQQWEQDKLQNQRDIERIQQNRFKNN